MQISDPVAARGTGPTILRTSGRTPEQQDRAGGAAAGPAVTAPARLDLDALPPEIIAIFKAAGIAKGSGEPNTNKVGTVTRAQLEEIAKAKEPDLTAASLDAAVRTIAGSARSMGLDVEGVEYE